MPLQTFHRLVNSGIMKAVLHVGGYRVYEDLFVDVNDGWAYDISCVDIIPSGDIIPAAPVPAVANIIPDIVDDEGGAAPVPVPDIEVEAAPVPEDADIIIPVGDDEAPAGDQPFELVELVKPEEPGVKHPRLT
jgi:hypothetical protein